MRERPAQDIPLDLVLPYLQREEKYIREAAIKTLMAAEQRVPIDPILSALHDPEPEVRAAASHACMSLVEWFPDQIPLELLLQSLHDEYAAVREDVLDAFGKIPLRMPVEPVIAGSGVFLRAMYTVWIPMQIPPAKCWDLQREMQMHATITLVIIHFG